MVTPKIWRGEISNDDLKQIREDLKDYTLVNDETGYTHKVPKKPVFHVNATGKWYFDGAGNLIF